ncbi:hypothetical protein SAMN05216262_11487 [Colwellia chukchiensis]|uniref:Uncharacterized protein n=1 Tax=Colwellia chukchiensis TaxID=641665 RepID=A0A1H7RFS7_9GAMM|nr:hypothetical protein [Colwellia chukchiensis]SEL59076.1 hypothetical protein SAMN05216262_11487 [Colwellia chukchiensis]
MNVNKLARLNCLFEKAVANNAKLIEQHELHALYEEFINQDRETKPSSVIAFSRNNAHQDNLPLKNNNNS